MAWFPFNLGKEKYQALDGTDDNNSHDSSIERKSPSSKGASPLHWKTLFAGIFFGLVIAVTALVATPRAFSRGDVGYLSK